MSLLFHKNSRKIMKRLFAVIGIVVAASMILLYAPGLIQLFK
jgi:hypothetical protein